MIPYTIGTSRFARALCDMGASINLISLAIIKPLGMRPPEQTTMHLLMVDYIAKKPIGISIDVLVNVFIFIFPAYFVILDFMVDFEIPIILGKYFKTMGR